MVNVVLDSELAERHIIITDKSKDIVLMNVTVMEKLWKAKDSNRYYKFWGISNTYKKVLLISPKKRH